MRLEANPQYYDYIHCIDFEKNHKCAFLDGAGQSICTDLKGTYKFNYITKKSGSILFEINDNKFHVDFHIENGYYLMMEEIIWNSTLEDWPFQLYTERFIFETDPFNGLYKNLQQEKNDPKKYKRT